MTVSEHELRTAAKLSRIRIPEEMIPGFMKEFQSILTFVEQLKQAQCDHVEPMDGGLDVPMRERQDLVTQGDQAEAILANAPDAAYGMFAVPKVVE